MIKYKNFFCDIINKKLKDFLKNILLSKKCPELTTDNTKGCDNKTVSENANAFIGKLKPTADIYLKGRRMMNNIKKILSPIVGIIVCAALSFGCVSAAPTAGSFTKSTHKAPSYNNDESKQGMGTDWTYEYSLGNDGEFSAMETGTGNTFYKAPGSYTARVVAEWGTDIYLVPGISAGKSVNISQTFNVKNDGYVTAKSCKIIRHFGMNDSGDAAKQDNSVAVFLNDKKIWPEGDGWMTIHAAAGGDQPVGNEVTMPELADISVKAGDKLRFAVGCGDPTYADWNDYTKWYVTVEAYASDGSTSSGSSGSESSGSSENGGASSEESAPLQDLSADMSRLVKTTYKAPNYNSEEAKKGLGDRWIYEYSLGYEADFSEMKNGTDKILLTSGHQTPAKFVAEWNTDLYMSPGFFEGKSVNAVQTFVAPANGYVTLPACEVTRHFKMKDTGDAAKFDCEIAIFVNGKKLWPEGNGWMTLSASATSSQPVGNVLKVPEIKNITVKKGDKIRLAVGCGNTEYAEWNDYVQWYATADMYTETAMSDGENISYPPTGDTRAAAVTALTAMVSLTVLMVCYSVKRKKKHNPKH